jgi:hypothetical protein
MVARGARPARELHPAGDAELPSEPLELVALRSFADEDEPRVRELGKGAHEHVEALLGRQAPE